MKRNKKNSKQKRAAVEAPEPQKVKGQELAMRNAVVEIRAAEGEQAASVRMSVSSEEPVLSLVYYNGEYQRVFEILDHAPESIDLSRAAEGLVILDRHYGDQIGLMAIDVAERKMSGPVSFCSGARAQEIFQDAANGLRRNVSVGYTVDADSYRLEGEQDGIPVVRAMSWMPFEASFEPVPADTTVGVNRADQTVKAHTAPIEKKEERKMLTGKEMGAMFARGAKYGIDTDAVQALISDESTNESVRSAIDALIVDKQDADLGEQRSQIKVLEDRKPEVPAERATVAPIGGSDEAAEEISQRFDVMKVVRSMSGMKEDIRFEQDVSDELGKLRGMPAEGLIIPHMALAKRDFTVAGTSSASVATNLLADEYIDLLRTKLVLGRLGVEFLTGLVGDIAIPKMTAGATGYWVTEGEDVTESQPSLGQVTGTPYTAGALVDISRKMMIQSTPSAEAMVRNEIIERVMRTVQIAVFAGTGADGQPSAITNATGINNPSVTAGTPTYAEILDFPGSIMADNAEADGQKFAMTAEVWSKLADTDIDSGSGRKVLNPETKKCIGYDYEMTEDLPANSLWFGNWRSVVLAIWGNGIDVAATDSKLFASGGVTLRALQSVDVMVRLGQSLAYNTAVTS